VLALCLGGACAGLAAINDVMGAQHRLLLNFTAGSGFIGIAVALMGRNHPLGIVLAAILFGAIYQGAASSPSRCRSCSASLSSSSRG